MKPSKSVAARGRTVSSIRLALGYRSLTKGRVRVRRGVVGFMFVDEKMKSCRECRHRSLVVCRTGKVTLMLRFAEWVKRRCYDPRLSCGWQRDRNARARGESR